MRINIDNISPNETKKKNQDLRRAGNNVDNAVQRKALRDTVASNAINNGNNNTDNNNLSRVPAETKGHMVSCLSTLYGQDLVWLFSLFIQKADRLLAQGTPVSSPSSGYNSSGTGGSQEDEGRQEEEERLLIDLSRYFITSTEGAHRRPMTYGTFQRGVHKGAIDVRCAVLLAQKVLFEDL